MELTREKIGAQALNVFGDGYIPSEFYLLLTSPRRDFYVDFMNMVLVELEAYPIGYEIKYTEFIQALHDYTVKCNSDLYNIEELEECKQNADTRNEFVSRIIKNYQEKKWIEVDINPITGERMIHITSHTRQYISLARNIRSEKLKVSATDIQSIHNNLMSNNLDFSLLTKVIDDLESHKAAMQGLVTDVEPMIQKLFRNNSISDLANNLNEMLNSKIFADYRRIRDDDEISKYRNKIIRKLKHLHSDEDETLSSIVEKHVLSLNLSCSAAEKRKIKAAHYNELERKLHLLFDFFKSSGGYDILLSDIQNKIAIYTDAAREQISLLMNKRNVTSDNLKAIINAAFEDISNDEESTVQLEGLFNIYNFGILTERSLTEFTDTASPASVHKSILPEINEEEEKKEIQRMIDKSKKLCRNEDFIAFIDKQLAEHNPLRPEHVEFMPIKDLEILQAALYIVQKPQYAINYETIIYDYTIPLHEGRITKFEIRRK